MLAATVDPLVGQIRRRSPACRSAGRASRGTTCAGSWPSVGAPTVRPYRHLTFFIACAQVILGTHTHENLNMQSMQPRRRAWSDFDKILSDGVSPHEKLLFGVVDPIWAQHAASSSIYPRKAPLKPALNLIRSANHSRPDCSLMLTRSSQAGSSAVIELCCAYAFGSHLARGRPCRHLIDTPHRRLPSWPAGACLRSKLRLADIYSDVVPGRFGSSKSLLCRLLRSKELVRRWVG